MPRQSVRTSLLIAAVVVAAVVAASLGQPVWAAVVGAGLVSPTGASRCSPGTGESACHVWGSPRRSARRHGPAPRDGARRAHHRRPRSPSPPSAPRPLVPRRLHGLHDRALLHASGGRRPRGQAGPGHEGQAAHLAARRPLRARRPGAHPRRRQGERSRSPREFDLEPIIKLPTIGPFDLSIDKAVIYLWLATAIIVVVAIVIARCSRRSRGAFSTRSRRSTSSPATASSALS